MSTTKNPAPVATGIDPGLYNPVVGPVGPLDTAPEPVPAGPGLGITATIPTPVPVVTIQTETVNVAATTDSSFVPDNVSTNTIRYISISSDGTVINSQATNINFAGDGVSVANGASASSVTVTITGGSSGSYGNSNVVTLLNSYGSNAISTTGNITGGYILGNGSQLTGLPATYSNSNVQAYLPTYSGNIGTLTINGNLIVTGITSTVNTEIVNVSESVVGNIDAGNLRTSGQISASGNITAANLGNISSINLNGNASSVLYGNGIFATATSSNPFDQDLNTTDNVQFANVTSTDAIRFSNSGNIVGALGYAPTYVSIESYGSNSVNITANDIYTWSFDSTGKLTSPNDVTQNTVGTVTCNAGAPTVIYTGSSTGKTTLKLLIQVEGAEVLGQQWDTQSCEMVVARGLRNNNVVGSVYGLAYTSTNPLATFNAIWNNATSKIEITCTPASLTLGVEARVSVIEMITSA